MISAEKFLKDVEDKPVYYYIYAYYDTQLNRFSKPEIDKESPESVADGCINAIKKGVFKPENAIGQVLALLGKFDIKTGNFELLEEAQALVDCEKCIPVKEEKLNA